MGLIRVTVYGIQGIKPDPLRSKLAGSGHDLWHSQGYSQPHQGVAAHLITLENSVKRQALGDRNNL